jgi:hypothetical protein
VSLLEGLVPQKYDPSRFVEIMRRIRNLSRYLTIGDPVINGTANLIFHADASGNVAQTTGFSISGTTMDVVDLDVNGNAEIGDNVADNHIIRGTVDFIGNSSTWAFRMQPDAIQYTQAGGSQLQIYEHENAAGSYRWENASFGDMMTLSGTAGQLRLPQAGSSAGLLVGADALWYRSAADTWRTPDKVIIDLTSESSNYPLLPKFIIPSMWNGLPEASEDVLRFVAPANCNVTLPSGLADSKFVAEIAATGSTTFTITKNGSSIGSANFAASATSATFTFSSDVTFSEDDKLQVTAPVSLDATLAGLSITLKGYRS